MHAVLRVATTAVLLGADRALWHGQIRNPCYKKRGDPGCWTSHIPNPVALSYSEVEHTYTHSEFPPELDTPIIERIKALKRQMIKANPDDPDLDPDLDHAFEAVQSINQLWIGRDANHEPGPLDDIRVKLPVMLDWIDECGWDIVSGDGKTFILKKRLTP